jgi:hypothetical protein
MCLDLGITWWISRLVGPAVDLSTHPARWDADHRAATGRPISRDNLREQMRIGRDRASASRRFGGRLAWLVTRPDRVRREAAVNAASVRR